MRKAFWTTVVGALLLIVVTVVTPLHLIVFPQPLTANQRAILRRANTGLAVFATKSPTANAYYQEATRLGRWSSCITVIPTPTDTFGRGKAFSVTVMSNKRLGLVAFYLYAAKSVCFIEPTCDSLSYWSLGLTYAHELSHRHDFERHLVGIGDVENSHAAQASEARAFYLEVTILQEYTAGRFGQAVDAHLKAYSKLPKHDRRRYQIHQMALLADNQWVHQEFGRCTPDDERSATYLIRIAAGIRKELGNQPASHADSINAAIAIMNAP